MATRTEKDSMGSVQVFDEMYWGAQTQRSLENFAIGGERYLWRRQVIEALGQVKYAAIKTNAELGLFDFGSDDDTQRIVEAMLHAAKDVIAGKLDEHFPLKVFQTGSGTHTNMNANEVIANRANESLGGVRGAKTPIHPNDHVNKGQSSNDVFPTVMHVAAIKVCDQNLLPALHRLRQVFEVKIRQYQDVYKTGRTHLQDAAPLSLAQEISAWAAQLEYVQHQIEHHKKNLYPIALGGTAVGTGLNTHERFAELVAQHLSQLVGVNLTSEKNKFFALAAHDPLVEMSAVQRTTAGALLKIANDVRWLGSGPRCGIGELSLPQNEPGSSIMPGKVNPTQCEALSMVCVQVFGNDAAVAFAGSQGNFQLNAFKPVILHNILESALLLADAVDSFNHHCAEGLQPNLAIIDDHLQRNTMMATVLNEYIGYDKASIVAKNALEKNLSVKQSCIDLGFASADQLNIWLDAKKMIYGNT